MTLRTEQSIPDSTPARAGRSAAPRHPIAFDSRPSLGERIVAAARVASAMHLTGAALIAADEAAIRALESREPSREHNR